RRADRGCRAGPRAETRRAHLAGTNRARAESPRLSAACRCPPHGRALGLRPAPLFSAAVGRDGRRPRADVPRAAAPGAVRLGVFARARVHRLGRDGARVPADPAVLSDVAAVGPGAPGDRRLLSRLHARFGLSACPRPGRDVEGPGPGRPVGNAMKAAAAAQASSGKTHRDENFPVASRLIAPRHRAIILAFYRLGRTADGVADHAGLGEAEKLALLDQLEQGLLGAHDREPDAAALRAALAERSLSPRHAQDLLTAFRMDVTKRRYRDWEDLIGYCSY